MKKYLKNKYLGFLLLVLLLGSSAFVVQAQIQQTDNFDFGYFQCTRHGFNESKDCNGIWDYYGSRNDYVEGRLDFNWSGHRHGSSGINSQVCLYSNYSFDCRTFSCSGASCGYEYGGEHPWNPLGPAQSITLTSAPSLYKVFRSASVTDAEVRVAATGSAKYEEQVYGCTDPSANNYNSAATVDDGSCTYAFNIVDLNFVVRNQSAVAISGASVNINQNFGNGTNRTTDGSGFANFGVNANTNIGYSVLATGCTTVNGSVNSGSGTTVEVTMNCTGPVAGNPPTCSPSDQNTFVGQTVNFTADSNGGGPVTWSAPGGSPATGSGLSFSASYAAAGVKTVTASNDNGSTYYSSCTVDVQDGSIINGVVSVDRPACSNVPYNAMIRWPGFGPGVYPDTGGSGYYVDVTTDPTFNTMWNRRVFAPADSTIALDGFSCLASNYCPGTPAGENMILQPNKTYYARIWNGSHQPNSSGISFNVPSCDPPPTLQAPVLPAACIPPTETYQATFNWSGAPHPTEGYYVDVTTDPSFNSFWNKKVAAIYNSTTGLSGFSCSDANWCFNPPPGETMELQPGKTYYARVYGGGGHSNTTEFTMPQCRLLSTSYNGSGTVTGPVGVSVTTGFPFPVVTLADGVNCGPGLGNCSEWYVDGATVNSIDATPDTGNQFGSWASGVGMICPGSTVSSCVFNITSNRTAQANFTGVTGFDYTLTTPNIASVTKGVSSSISHPVTRNLGVGVTTGQPVILSVSGLPAGVTVAGISNNHSSCTVSGCPESGFESPSNITLTIDSTAPVGPYTITVTGTTSGGPVRTDTFTLDIGEAKITVSCSSNPTPPNTAALGQEVTWTALARGTGTTFNFTWSGIGIPTNPPPSSNSPTYKIAYSTIGNKSASVTAVDNEGRSTTAVCNGGVPLRVRFSPTFNEF